ncbi:CPBP family intramembrane metalloprotease [Hymenobacter gummosus]|uniref:CPBP family intramembrane metalloprotease n=2 Tax=Hymenobacter gummosus TaxID=1776032 RepID=A0A431U3V8_9BACT|nr:CPBP family intramembrane metalloprotease [Hymenobacter gummosus]
MAAVLLTAAGKFLFMDYLHWRLPFILTAMAAWGLYVFVRQRRRPGILAYWGFRTDNFGRVLRLVLPFGLGAVAACALIGTYRGSLNLTWHILPILLLYPLWGTVQQFLLIALTAGNLHELPGIQLGRVLIVLLSAALFGAIHYPFGWLMLGTFVLAVFYGFVYLKERNLYVLGIFHGWLGAIFFYTVVGRDPFMEVFGRLL